MKDLVGCGIVDSLSWNLRICWHVWNHLEFFKAFQQRMAHIETVRHLVTTFGTELFMIARMKAFRRDFRSCKEKTNKKH